MAVNSLHYASRQPLGIGYWTRKPS